MRKSSPSACLEDIRPMIETAPIERAAEANARIESATAKRLGRPRRVVDASRIAALRASEASWRAISRELGVGLATLYRATATK
jgi:DNA invertase Pin-like site-specific DNA recombinase